jgi:hypothetical protein
MTFNSDVTTDLDATLKVVQLEFGSKAQQDLEKQQRIKEAFARWL